MVASEEVRRVLKEYRIPYEEGVLNHIFEHLDEHQTGKIPCTDLINRLAGTLQANRRKLVEDAFARISREASEVVDRAYIKDCFKAQYHPDVRSGKRSADDVYFELSDTFDAHASFCKTSKGVAKSQFEDYYRYVSMTIESEKIFEDILNDCWVATLPEVKKKPKEEAKVVPPYDITKDPTEYRTGKDDFGAMLSQQRGKNASVFEDVSDRKLISILRQSVLSRGIRGVIGLLRAFKVIRI